MGQLQPLHQRHLCRIIHFFSVCTRCQTAFQTWFGLNQPLFFFFFFSNVQTFGRLYIYIIALQNKNTAVFLKHITGENTTTIRGAKRDQWCSTSHLYKRAVEPTIQWQTGSKRKVLKFDYEIVRKVVVVFSVFVFVCCWSHCLSSAFWMMLGVCWTACMRGLMLTKIFICATAN